MTGPSSSATAGRSTASYENLHKEFVAIVLASTVGTRLFPLTDSTGIPKHLLDVAGVSIFQRLLHNLDLSGFTECIVAISHDDHQTIESIKAEIQRQHADIEKEEGSKVKQQTPSSSSRWKEIKSFQEASSAAAQGPRAIGTGSSSMNQASSSENTSGMGAPGAHSETSTTTQAGVGSVCFQFMIAEHLKVTIVRLDDECQGSVGALCQIELIGIISPKSHIVVLPGDLVLLDTGAQDQQPVLMDLVHTHRRAQSSKPPASCTMLLSDVGETDESGIPLKESSKAKKGRFSREEDDIEYIALSYPSPKSKTTVAPRVVWKQSKMEAEEDRDMTGATPKLLLPKPRLRLGEITKVRIDWNDVHVYVLSPWVRRLILVRNSLDEPQTDKSLSLISMADDVLPLLITRQFLSIQHAFGSKMESTQVEELMNYLGSQSDFGFSTSTSANQLLEIETASGIVGKSDATTSIKANRPFAVMAHIQNCAFRSSTIAAYIYVTREIISKALSVSQGKTNGPSSTELLMLPESSSIRHKFQTIILPDSSIGEKVTFKSAVVGRDCKLGTKCRLNNVILLDQVTLGDNVSLQNTVVGRGAVIGDNCSFNDCQVAPGKSIPSGTKSKGEAFTVDADIMG